MWYINMQGNNVQDINSISSAWKYAIMLHQFGMYCSPLFNVAISQQFNGWQKVLEFQLKLLHDIGCYIEQLKKTNEILKYFWSQLYF